MPGQSPRLDLKCIKMWMRFDLQRQILALFTLAGVFCGCESVNSGNPVSFDGTWSGNTISHNTNFSQVETYSIHGTTVLMWPSAAPQGPALEVSRSAMQVGDKLTFWTVDVATDRHYTLTLGRNGDSASLYEEIAAHSGASDQHGRLLNKRGIVTGVLRRVGPPIAN